MIQPRLKELYGRIGKLSQKSFERINKNSIEMG